MKLRLILLLEKIIKKEIAENYFVGNESITNETNSNTQGSENNGSMNGNNQSNNHMQAKITPEEAKEIALKRTNGGDLVKCKLDYDDGFLRYEIEIYNNNKEFDIEIDANTERL